MMIEANIFVTIILSVIGTLGSTGAWNYYQKRLEYTSMEKNRKIDESYVYRDDLRERVAILESKLEDSHAERDKLMTQIGVLAQETAALRVEVRYLTDERDRLLNRLEDYLETN